MDMTLVIMHVTDACIKSDAALTVHFIEVATSWQKELHKGLHSNIAMWLAIHNTSCLRINITKVTTMNIP